MGISAYMSWRIRRLPETAGASMPAPEALWPADERTHCLWALESLRRVEPRIETAELEQRVRELA